MTYAYVKNYGDARIVAHLTALLWAKARADGVEVTALSCRSSDDGDAWIFEGVTRWAAMPQTKDALRGLVSDALRKAKSDQEGRAYD